MKKEDAIKYLQQLYPNGGHCWLDEQRMEAIDMAVKALQEEPKPKFKKGDTIRYTDGDIRTVIEVREDCYKLDDFSILHFNAQDNWELVRGPVSEIDFEQELYKAFGQVKDFTLGMQIAKWFYEMGRKYHEPVSDDLEEEIIRYIGYPQDVDEDVSTTMIRKAACHFANWQKQQDSKLPKIWPRDTIEEYAYQCAYDLSNDWVKETPEWNDVQNACILGAQWQKEKDMQKFLHSETATFTREEFDAEIEEVRKQTKEQMMKDMPKWKKHIKSLLVEGAEEIPCVLSNRLLAYHGYTIEIAELEKLPKED